MASCQCGAELPPGRNRRTCGSPACKRALDAANKRAIRRADAAKLRVLRESRVLSLITPPPTDDQPAEGRRVGSIADATVAKLQAHGADGTAEGLLAIKLARVVDQMDVETISAPVVRELRAALAAATAAAPVVEDDPIARRAARRDRAG